jgi:hypothetical protein
MKMKKGKTSDARATLEHSVITGLSKRADLTGVTITDAEVMVPDLIEAIFHPSVRWAVAAYLKEPEGAEPSAERKA